MHMYRKLGDPGWSTAIHAIWGPHWLCTQLFDILTKHVQVYISFSAVQAACELCTLLKLDLETLQNISTPEPSSKTMSGQDMFIINSRT